MMSQINLRKYNDLLYDESSKNNRNATPIYGPFEKLFLSNWGQSDIHHDIVKSFDNMGINRMTPIQQNSFLYLMKNYNTAMIGFSKGKSTSYLASIFSSIMSNNDVKMNNAAIGPKAIILSNSLGSCSTLEDLSKKLICSAKTKKVNVVVAYASISVEQTIGTLCNGCDILIATPTILLNLLNKVKIFTWLNLRHFVFDNIDLLLGFYKDQMLHFFKILLKLQENGRHIQMISASVKWTKDIDEFLRKLCVKWQYIFGSHLEAARYMKVKFSVVQVKDDKLEQILKFLKNNINCRRCVLMTSNTDELSIISNYIKQNGSDLEVLLPGQMKCTKIYTLQRWNMPLEKSQLILICSDDMMFDFYIEDADCLFHFDIPINKNTFSIRFSVLQDSTNALSKKERSTFIFLSSNNKDMLQLPKVVEIMKVFGSGKVEPILLKHAKLINEAFEKDNKSRLFCSALQQFGNCSKPLACHNRHTLLKELDEPAVNIPQSGLAIIKILNVYDASHMSAKLLKLNCTNNLNDQNNWLNVEDHSDIINNKLSSFYENQNSRILFEKPKPGDIVVVHLENEIQEQMGIEYFRAIVIDEVDKNTMCPKVRVKLIDLGYIKVVSKWSLFVLPDAFKSILTTTVDIFLASVKPIDFDETWCSQANIRVQKKLKFAENCCDIIIVKITMALGTTLWIKKLYKKYWNSTSKTYEFEAILPDMLINIGYADKNFEHTEKLTELSVLAGITMPSTFKSDNGKNHNLSLKEYMSLYKLPQPQWAHLDQNVTTVSLDYMISPKLFFVRNSKFSDILNDLQEKINYYVEQKQVEKLRHIVKGAICLTLLPSTNQYSRIQILDVFLNDKTAEVWFVDFGDIDFIKFNMLLTIHPDLIVQLPFQVIECSLTGVKDIQFTNEEKDVVIEYIFNLTQNHLNLKVLNTIATPKLSGGSHYEVVLYDEAINVNFEFQTEFSQYCDDTQMSNLHSLLNNEDALAEENNDEPCVINENFFMEDNVNPEDKISEIQLLEQFALSIFGPRFKDMIESAESNTKDVVNENSLTETTVTEFTLKDKPMKDIAAIESTEKIKSIDSVTLKKKSFELKNHKLKLFEKHKKLCLSCNSNVSIVPVCIWYQDEYCIYLKFNILEVDNFKIDSTVTGITFKAQFKNVSYAFTSKLYGFIVDKNVTYKRSFEGFHIKAEKLVKIDYKWPRLFECCEWHKYVKYDPEHIGTKKITLNVQVLNNFKMLALGTPLNKSDEEIDSNTDISDNDFDINSTEDVFTY